MEEKKNEIVTGKMTTDFNLGIFGTSDNFLMATQMAKALASSTVVPKEYQGNFANGLIAIEIAQRVKTSPLMVMQNLNVIQGKPSWSAQFLIAMINGSGKYDIELQYDEKVDDHEKPFSCQCWTVKNGRKITGISVDMDMANAEGWVSKSGSKWKSMPQVMLRYRAASFFARMNCPELTLGYYTKEEVIDADWNEVQEMEDIRHKVEREIAQNANTVDFIEEHTPEPEEAAEADETPDFMKD